MFSNIRLNVRLGIRNHFTIFCSFFLFLLCDYFELCVRALYAKDISNKHEWGSEQFQMKINFEFSMLLQGYLISLLSSVFHTYAFPNTYAFTLTISKIMFDLHLSKRSYLFEAHFHFICTNTHTPYWNSCWIAKANSNWKQQHDNTSWSDFFVMWKIEALFLPFFFSFLFFKHLSKMKCVNTHDLRLYRFWMGVLLHIHKHIRFPFCFVMLRLLYKCVLNSSNHRTLYFNITHVC